VLRLGLADRLLDIDQFLLVGCQIDFRLANGGADVAG